MYPLDCPVESAEPEIQFGNGLASSIYGAGGVSCVFTAWATASGMALRLVISAPKSGDCTSGVTAATTAAVIWSGSAAMAASSCAWLAIILVSLRLICARRGPIHSRPVIVTLYGRSNKLKVNG